MWTSQLWKEAHHVLDVVTLSLVPMMVQGTSLTRNLSSIDSPHLWKALLCVFCVEWLVTGCSLSSLRTGKEMWVRVLWMRLWRVVG